MVGVPRSTWGASAPGARQAREGESCLSVCVWAASVGGAYDQAKPDKAQAYECSDCSDPIQSVHVVRPLLVFVCMCFGVRNVA